MYLSESGEYKTVGFTRNLSGEMSINGNKGRVPQRLLGNWMLVLGTVWEQLGSKNRTSLRCWSSGYFAKTAFFVVNSNLHEIGLNAQRRSEGSQGIGGSSNKGSVDFCITGVVIGLFDEFDVDVDKKERAEAGK